MVKKKVLGNMSWKMSRDSLNCVAKKKIVVGNRRFKPQNDRIVKLR